MEKIRLIVASVILVVATLFYASAGAVFGNLVSVSMTAQTAPVRFVAGTNAVADYISTTIGTNETTASVSLTTFPVPKAWYMDFLRVHNYDTAKTFNIGLAVSLNTTLFDGKVSDLVIYLYNPATSSVVATIPVYQGGVFQGTGSSLWTGYIATLAPDEELRIDIFVSFYDGVVKVNDTFPMDITVYWSTSTEAPLAP